MFPLKVKIVLTQAKTNIIWILIVIAKTEQMNKDMKFIGQMANANLTASFGTRKL